MPKKTKTRRKERRPAAAVEGVEKMILVRPSILKRMSSRQGNSSRRKQATQKKKKSRQKTSSSRGPPPRRGFSPQVRNRTGSRAAKKRQKVTALWDTDEDEEVRLVAAVPPSQVGQQRRLRRLQRQLKQRRSNAAGPSWSRRDMLDYNAKLGNALEQQDLGRTVQGAARAPAAVRVAPEEDSDDDYDGEDDDDLDEDTEAVEEVMAVRDQVVPVSVAQRARTLLKLIRKHDQGRGNLSWTKGSHELVIKGKRLAGTDIFDLAVHVTRDRRAKRPQAGSPGPPPGFDRFARALRTLGAGAGREIMRNRRRWPQLFRREDQEGQEVNSSSTPKKWLLFWRRGLWEIDIEDWGRPGALGGKKVSSGFSVDEHRNRPCQGSSSVAPWKRTTPSLSTDRSGGAFPGVGWSWVDPMTSGRQI